MKTIIFLLCTFFAITVYAQNGKEHELKGVTVTQPKFTGIKKAVVEQNTAPNINAYLRSQINPANLETKFRRDGTEVIDFVVNPNGEISDIEVVNSVNRAIDEEVIRVLKTTEQMWIPGANDDQPVAMPKEITIAFKYGVTDDAIIKKKFVSMARHDFVRAGKLLYLKDNAKRALKHYDYCFNLLPNDKGVLAMRGLCRYQLNDKEGAFEDWNRLRSLGGIDFSEVYPEMAMDNNMKSLKGYETMISMLKE